MEEFNIITQNGIYYLLNEESKTAIVVNWSLKQEYFTDLTDNLEDLYIPQQITHGKILMFFPKKYTVTSIGDHAFYLTKISINLKRVFIPPKLIKICKSAFEDCESLCEVIIPDDSELQVIEKNAFKNTLVENLSLPKTICDIKNAFTKAFCLKTIEIHPENKHYAKYNDFIIGKSDIKSEVFDTLIFSRRDIINATIPSFIKVIGSCAFHLCSELQRIEIPNDSELQIIENNAFYSSKLQSITFSKSIIEFKEKCFNYVEYLTDFEIDHENNRYQKYGDFIIGKSDVESDVFDVLVFAKRDVINATIPPFIKIIHSCAFANCNQLRHVKITNDSKLQTIKKNAFKKSSINSINVPPSLISIDKKAFCDCTKLKIVDIPENSNLQIIDKCAFKNTGIEKILIPSSLLRINDEAFINCSLLKFVGINSDSNLQIIEDRAFFRSPISSIFLPDSIVNVAKDAFNNFVNIKVLQVGKNIDKMSFLNLLRALYRNLEVLFIPPGFITRKEIVSFIYDMNQF